jgi:hypothetical protein
MIPPRELWEQFERGKLCENHVIMESIESFRNNREALEAKEEDDLPDSSIDAIYKSISMGAKNARQA